MIEGFIGFVVAAGIFVTLLVAGAKVYNSWKRQGKDTQ